MSAEKETTEKKPETTQPDIQVQVDNSTAFNLKLMEFDKDIAVLEYQTAQKKAEKMSFIYDSNIQAITADYTQKQMQKQVEEEVKKKLANADTK
jgi:hypothetical protein